jgi:hypothetical protein
MMGPSAVFIGPDGNQYMHVSAAATPPMAACSPMPPVPFAPAITCCHGSHASVAPFPESYHPNPVPRTPGIDHTTGGPGPATPQFHFTDSRAELPRRSIPRNPQFERELLTIAKQEMDERGPSLTEESVSSVFRDGELLVSYLCKVIKRQSAMIERLQALPPPTAAHCTATATSQSGASRRKSSKGPVGASRGAGARSEPQGTHAHGYPIADAPLLSGVTARHDAGSLRKSSKDREERPDHFRHDGKRKRNDGRVRIADALDVLHQRIGAMSNLTDEKRVLETLAGERGEGTMSEEFLTAIATETKSACVTDMIKQVLRDDAATFAAHGSREGKRRLRLTHRQTS